MTKYILFGAGKIADEAINMIEPKNISFIIDNNTDKQGTDIQGVPIYSLEYAKNKIGDSSIVISVSKKFVDEIKIQLIENGINRIIMYSDLRTDIIREKIKARTNYIEVYNKAINWIDANTVDGEGIICNTSLKKSYPEVTGYYIPTLIKWGYRDRAISYAKWLCSIQKDDGSWYDTDNNEPYIFDSAQILKGLIAVREIYPEVDNNIMRGCEWILSRMDDDGRLVTPSEQLWGDSKTCSELIHTYCISPLIDASKIFNKPDYEIKARKIFNYYKKEYYESIMNFSLLSHFYAYVMEALVDLGEIDMVREAMAKIADIQKNDGSVPAYNNVNWICSTGLFQLALVWYRLGELEHGNKAFEFACKLQNKTGGWYGSYIIDKDTKENNTYFPNEEISWAVKYFLDALYFKNKLTADMCTDSLSEHFFDIDSCDEKYKIIESEICKHGKISVADIGCGFGRYLKKISVHHPNNSYYGVDLSQKIMQSIPDNINTKEGALTNIPYPDNSFDITYACESLEHAIDIKSSVREMARVTISGGKIIIIDKNIDKLGALELGECEQWFDVEHLKNIMLEFCSGVNCITDISENKKTHDALFTAWIGTVNK